MVGRPAKSSASSPIIRRLINPNVRQIDLFYQSHNRLLLEKNQSSRKLTLPFLRLRNQAIYSLSMFLIATVLLIQSFGIPNYIYALTQSTKLYEENYVNPKTAKIDFPREKTQLNIHLFRVNGKHFSVKG